MWIKNKIKEKYGKQKRLFKKKICANRWKLFLYLNFRTIISYYCLLSILMKLCTPFFLDLDIKMSSVKCVHLPTQK